MMLGILWFIVASFGLTAILTSSKLLAPLRPDYHFFHCPMCVGFHVGVFLWAISPFTSLFMFEAEMLTAFLLGCISSGTSWILVSIGKSLEK